MRINAIFQSAACVLLGLMSGAASADVIEWTDWTGLSEGDALGTIGSVGVTFTASGGINFLQTGTGTNYWTEGSNLPYTASSTVDNAPTAAEMVSLNLAGTNTIVFSEAVLNPIMAIVSMGQPGEVVGPYDGVEYGFNAPFTLLSEGQGYWGDGWYDINGNTLTGFELHGVIQFQGSLDSITWTSTSEYWHGFTFGLASEVPEPGTLALFGLGLAGLGFARRRKA